MKKGSTHNACNAYSPLKFEAEKLLFTGGWCLFVVLDDSAPAFFRKSGADPIALILNRCGIMERVGHKVQKIVLRQSFLTQERVGTLVKSFGNLFARYLILEFYFDGELPMEWESQGVFDLALPPFP